MRDPSWLDVPVEEPGAGSRVTPTGRRGQGGAPRKGPRNVPFGRGMRHERALYVEAGLTR